MEFKHTSAPWQLAGGNNENYEVNCGYTVIDLTKCDKNTGQHVISRDEMEANALLITEATTPQ